ncbi:MAG TPA: branched-chain amino acid ABC transporter permease [Thermodesulfobacteriota bacterium]|nr:branched-chain amino acid ABC transporter permease [Thermodesulfobacteriota bacterium]
MKPKDLYIVFIIALVIGVFPWLTGRNEYFISLLVFMGINGMITLGLSLLMGYAGQISLGHAAFFGLGAYSSGILTVHYGLSPVAGFLFGILLSAAVAYLVGKPTLRLKGHYMAVATLGFGEIVFILFNELSFLTGGPSGLSGIPALAVGDLSLEGTAYLYLVWGLVLLLLLFSLNLINSRVGRALRAVHGSELAAGAMGVDASLYKIQVFVLSAVYASMGGSLYAHFISFISPSSFSLMFSILLLMMVVVGGTETIWGAILGAAVLTLLPEYLRGLEDFEVLAYGAILMAVLLFMPKGILEGFQRLWARAQGGS